MDVDVVGLVVMVVGNVGVVYVWCVFLLCGLGCFEGV